MSHDESDPKNSHAELRVGKQKFSLPMKTASVGPNVIDVSKLYASSNYFTYDVGFMSTAACESSITYIDGEKGILRHRGYNIQDLAENCNFLEVCYLLLNGELPKEQEFQDFVQKITNHSLLNENLRNLFSAFHPSAHPMAVTLAAVGSLSAFYHDVLDIKDIQDRDMSAIRLIAKMPTIAAMAHKHSIGQPFMYPDNSRDFIENFLYMMMGTPCEKYVPNKIFTKALNKLFILHADHEQNASTATVRICGSSGANPFACMSAGIASLWGPSHGGANEAVIKMLHKIGKPSEIKEYIARAKDPASGFRLMGFGHRVYKNYDPRAAVLKDTCKEVLGELGQASKTQNNNILEIAAELEKIALNDEYFIQRKLYPNVDFYSGIIYEALGIPTKMFTVLFAVARTSGWMAQWKEMIEDKSVKISRPRQLYIGETERDFVPMCKR